MHLVLETERLLLSEFSDADAPGMFELNSDPLVLQYTGDLPFDSIEAARLFIEQYDQYRKNGFGRWTVRLKNSGEYLGWCGLRRADPGSEVDLGFRSLRRYWNKGYATEAARACVQYGFDTLGLGRIVGRARRDNHASIRVLEKIGMRFVQDIDFEGKAGLFEVSSADAGGW